MSDFDQLTREFLNFLSEPREAGPADYRRLTNLLDRIAAAVTLLAETGLPYNYEGVPSTISRTSLSQRFKNLGLYHTVCPRMDLSSIPETTVGDAIDDLLDIAHELESALAQSNPLASAAEGFYAHWGYHLRGLQSYLLAQETGV